MTDKIIKREAGTWSGFFYQMVVNGFQPPSWIIVCEEHLTDHMIDEKGQLVCTLLKDDKKKAIVPELDELWAGVKTLKMRSGAPIRCVSREELRGHIPSSPWSGRKTAVWIVFNRMAIEDDELKLLVEQFRKKEQYSKTVPIVLPFRTIP